MIPLIAVPITIWQVVVCRPANLARVNAWIVEHRPPRCRWRRSAAAAGRGGGCGRRYATATPGGGDDCFLWAETGVASLTTQFTSTIGVALGLAAILSGLSGATGWIGQVVWGRCRTGAGAS